MVASAIPPPTNSGAENGLRSKFTLMILWGECFGRSEPLSRAHRFHRSMLSPAPGGEVGGTHPDSRRRNVWPVKPFVVRIGAAATPPRQTRERDPQQRLHVSGDAEKDQRQQG